MRERQLESLRLELLKGGVTPFYVERTIAELGEHYADLEIAALAAGLTAEEAARSASDALGDERAIVAATLARRVPEFGRCDRRTPGRTAAVLHRAPARARALGRGREPRRHADGQRARGAELVDRSALLSAQNLSRHSYGCTVFSGFHT
jgi:hypothetical protein